MNQPLNKKDPGEIEVPAFKHDLDLSDRYQNFSGEILRLSILGIGGIGFLLVNVFLTKGQQRVPLSRDEPVFSWLAAASLFCLGVSAAASLAHRYFATDCLSYHLDAMRKKAVGHASTAIVGRDRMFKLSKWSLISASVFLATGTILLALAFVFGLLYG
jgi:hypothetical protein